MEGKKVNVIVGGNVIELRREELGSNGITCAVLTAAQTRALCLDLITALRVVEPESRWLGCPDCGCSEFGPIKPDTYADWKAKVETAVELAAMQQRAAAGELPIPMLCPQCGKGEPRVLPEDAERGALGGVESGVELAQDAKPDAARMSADGDPEGAGDPQ